MDQRQDARFEADQAVTVTTLGKNPSTRQAVIRNASGRGFGLEMKGHVAPGTAVKIEFEDNLLLGEVVYTRTLEDSVLVGVRLTEALRGLAELAQACQEYAAIPGARG